MKYTRRKTVFGLATLTVGASLIAGAGAFTSVDADRDVTVEFADDSDAVLRMTGPDDLPGFVAVEENDDGEIEIHIERVNRSARTQVTDLVEFTNNGASSIETVSFSLDDDSTNAELSLVEENLGTGLDVGESVVGLGFSIETRTSQGFEGDPEVSGTITVSAETDT